MRNLTILKEALKPLLWFLLLPVFLGAMNQGLENLATVLFIGFAVNFALSCWTAALRIRLILLCLKIKFSAEVTPSDDTCS